MRKQWRILWLFLLVFNLLCSVLVVPLGTCSKTRHDTNHALTDDYDRWAVIIGISDYQGGEHDLHSPAHEAELFYNALKIRDARWVNENMKLLTDQQATKAGIFAALDWLEENADDGDRVIFTYNGHGSFVEDNGHDELDRRDEVIVTWEISYITDDELGARFDLIEDNNVSGMFLVFDSCLSGGLIDWIPWPWEHSSIRSAYSDEGKPWVAASYYSKELTTDIATKNRVVLVSSIPRGIALSLNGPDGWFGFTRGLSRAVERGRQTAEGICRYAKISWLLNPTLLRVMFNPLLWLISVEYWMNEKLLICPFPMWNDRYPASFPPGDRLSLVQ